MLYMTGYIKNSYQFQFACGYTSGNLGGVNLQLTSLSQQKMGSSIASEFWLKMSLLK